MGYNIGIDFGTTNTTVSFLEDEKHLDAFRYPDPRGYQYIPSCVVYETEDKPLVGWAAYQEAANNKIIFCNNIKMYLPMLEGDLTKYGWPSAKKPEDVITDYFSNILTNEEEGFTSQKGAIDGIVISVPHVWAKAIDHAGRSKLESIIRDKMNLPLIQLISEPVAAAAYFAYRYQEKESTSFDGNLLICDVGGGTFDVTLCKVLPGKVEELYNDGNGQSGLGKAGVFFDRKLILEANRRQGVDIEDNSSNFYSEYTDLQDYKTHRHKDITKKLLTAIDDDDMKKNPIMKAGNIELNFNDIQAAFDEVEKGIIEVLTRFKMAITEKGYAVDAIFFVGGFAEFLLVRETIKKFWNIGQNDKRLFENLNKEISRYAISYGAALVANGKISVEEKFEHTIGIEGFVLKKIRDNEFERKSLFLPIIVGGKKMSEYEMINYAEYPVKAHNERPEITIYVDEESKNRIVKHKLPEELNIKLPNAHIPGNQWKVGMMVNKSKVVYMIFKDSKGVRSKPYELGDILRKMFGGFEVLRED